MTGTPATAVSEINRLAWLLDDLEAPGVRFAVLLSEDGLRIAHTGGVSIDDAERFAAAAWACAPWARPWPNSAAAPPITRCART